MGIPGERFPSLFAGRQQAPDLIFAFFFFLAGKCAAAAKFSTQPTHFSLPGNIGNHQQKQNTKKVKNKKNRVAASAASGKWQVACCLLPVASGSVDPARPIMRGAASGEIDEDAQMQTHSSNGQYGDGDGPSYVRYVARTIMAKQPAASRQ